MNKNDFAKTPPMGWNSWDCFGASINEAELLANADYMAEHLKQHGWEYVVCDIQWYEPTADSTEYHDFVPLEMDQYSRLIPAEERFPSAAHGVGFRYISDYIHRKGLKFGIHIMRGIPRQAVHAATPIKGSTATARDIAQRFSVCSWNTDMYGVNPNAYGAQAYYDSLFELYAEWGVDFVKVDDICNTYYKPHDLYSAEGEVELIRNAIDKCGREMVLSLSPGPADVKNAEHLMKNANMWRMSADFWDDWEDLQAMFKYCNIWSPYVGNGCWPDCDMLPLGHLSIRGDAHGLKERYTRLSQDEQITLMTLWCMFRSPLMMGGNLPDNDEFTNSLLTDDEVLEIVKNSHGAHQVIRTGTTKENVVWESYGEDDTVYVALFNMHVISRNLEVSFAQLAIEGNYRVYDLWKHKELGETEERVSAVVPAHGAVLLRLRKKQ